MLLLSLPAVAIGIMPGLVSTMMTRIASVLQDLLWQRLPGTPGVAQDSPLWIIGVLTLMGIAVGLVVRFSQNYTGPDPAYEPPIGAPVPPSVLPGLIVALILGPAGGINLGSEHPVITVNVVLIVVIDTRLLPRVSQIEWTILVSAGTIGALFDTPVATALIFSQILNDNSEVPLWDRLFTPLMVTVAGAFVTGLLSHPYFSLPVVHYGQMEMTDILNGTVIAATVIVTGTVTAQYLPWLHAMTHQIKDPVLALGTGRSILGILRVIDRPVSLFKELGEVQQMVVNRAFSTGNYFLLTMIKLTVLVATAASDFHGGRVFPVMFVDVALGLMLHEHVPAVSVAITISRVVLGIVLVVTRDGWLNLLVAAIIVPNTILLSLLRTVMLPVWLLLVDKPVIMVNRQKQQPPHDNI